MYFGEKMAMFFLITVDNGYINFKKNDSIGPISLYHNNTLISPTHMHVEIYDGHDGKIVPLLRRSSRIF